MRARFLLKWRTGEDGQPEAQARLVIEGFRDPDAFEGKLETSSPTATCTARQNLLSAAASGQWPLYASDVATAFLQGEPQQRVLYVKLPSDAARMVGADHIRVDKPMLGQTVAPRAWLLCE